MVGMQAWRVDMAGASMDRIDAAAGGGSGLFLRKATGLVRYSCHFFK